jgi:hypothetical protein
MSNGTVAESRARIVARTGGTRAVLGTMDRRARDGLAVVPAISDYCGGYVPFSGR